MNQYEEEDEIVEIDPQDLSLSAGCLDDEVPQENKVESAVQEEPQI